MSEARDPLGGIGEAFRLLLHAPKSRYLALENLITGGLRWRIHAWRAGRQLARATENQIEASGAEFDAKLKAWRDLDHLARFGSTLSQTGREEVRRLIDAGVSEPQIRTWIVNKHMDEDGNLKPRYRRIADKIVRSLGWIWHGLVVTSAFLFVVYAWSLPGPVWKKAAASIGVIFFFLTMSALMNSTSLSALPPRTKPFDRTCNR